MTIRKITRRARLGTAMAALAVTAASFGAAAPVAAKPKAYASGTYRPTNQVPLSVGEGQMINLPRNVATVWTSNPAVADVYINSPRQINLFGKAFGDSTVIATAADGSVVYGAQVRVSQNLPTINELLKAAMPESDVRVAMIGQTAILQGTVASPDDAAFITQLTARELNPGVDMSQPGAQCKICVVSRLKTATPLQVTLKVRIAEVNRSQLKQWGINLLTSDPTSGFRFGIAQGQGISLPPADCVTGCAPPTVIRNAIGSTLSASGVLFGLDVLSSLDIAAQDGVASILAEPNLSALSGETASFLAGGEFPIPVSQGNNAVTIEYKQYGVGLAFTPIVLADGRISMRVRPEVSEISLENAVRLNGFTVPALVTRRAETTVELGSGQSFMIAGLIRNSSNNNIDKAPILGDLPVLGALFRSTSFRRNETELVVIVTPYLVRPVSHQLATPVDGLRVPDDIQRDFLGQSFKGVSGPSTPVPPPGNRYPNGAVAPAAATAPVPGVSVPAASAAAPGFKL